MIVLLLNRLELEAKRPLGGLGAFNYYFILALTRPGGLSIFFWTLVERVQLSYVTDLKKGQRCFQCRT